MQSCQAGLGSRAGEIRFLLMVVAIGKTANIEGGDLRAIGPWFRHAYPALVEQDEVAVAQPGIVGQKIPPIRNTVGIEPISVPGATGYVNDGIVMLAVMRTGDDDDRQIKLETVARGGDPGGSRCPAGGCGTSWTGHGPAFGHPEPVTGDGSVRRRLEPAGDRAQRRFKRWRARRRPGEEDGADQQRDRQIQPPPGPDMAIHLDPHF